MATSDGQRTNVQGGWPDVFDVFDSKAGDEYYDGKMNAFYSWYSFDAKAPGIVYGPGFRTDSFFTYVQTFTVT